MNVYDLLIIFTNGETKTISGVSRHMCHSEGIFSFEKNGYRGFIPLSNVKYFGRAFDWADEKTDSITG